MNRQFVWQTLVRVQAERGATAQSAIDFADEIVEAFDARFPAREELPDCCDPQYYSVVGCSVLDSRRPGQYAKFTSEMAATRMAAKLNAGDVDDWEWTIGEPPT